MQVGPDVLFAVLFAHATPIEINLRPGDLFYSPACWWHCVEGSRERNMILNWWFDLHPRKKAHDGED